MKIALIVAAILLFLTICFILKELFLSRKQNRIVKAFRENPELNKILDYLESLIGRPAETFIAPGQKPQKVEFMLWSFIRPNSIEVPVVNGNFIPGAKSKYYFGHEAGHLKAFREDPEKHKKASGCSFSSHFAGYPCCFWKEALAWQEAKAILQSIELLKDEEKTKFNLMALLGILLEALPCLESAEKKMCPLFGGKDDLLREIAPFLMGLIPTQNPV